MSNSEDVSILETRRLNPDDLVTFVVAVSYDGTAMVIEAPDEVRNIEVDGPLNLAENIRKLPEEPGLYLVVARFCWHGGWCDGYPAPGECEWDYSVQTATLLWPLSSKE